MPVSLFLLRLWETALAHAWSHGCSTVLCRTCNLRGQIIDEIYEMEAS